MTHCYETDRRKGKGVMSFGTQLRLARKRKGLTQKELAEKIGTKQTYIAQLERGRRNITLATIEKYARACGKRIAITLI